MRRQSGLAAGAEQAVRGGRQGSGRVALAVQLLFVLVLVAAVTVGLWAALRDDLTQADIAPSEVGSLRLVQLITGPEALAGMRRLHGEDVGLVDGWIARYEGGATIWVGTAPDAAQASDLVVRMSERIGEGTSPFTMVGTRALDGLTLYEVEGQGQRHAYYQKGRDVIWITAAEGDGAAFLAEAARRLP